MDQAELVNVAFLVQTSFQVWKFCTRKCTQENPKVEKVGKNLAQSHVRTHNIWNSALRTWIFSFPSYLSTMGMLARVFQPSLLSTCTAKVAWPAVAEIIQKFRLSVHLLVRLVAAREGHSGSSGLELGEPAELAGTFQARHLVEPPAFSSRWVETGFEVYIGGYRVALCEILMVEDQFDDRSLEVKDDPVNQHLFQAGGALQLGGDETL